SNTLEHLDERLAKNAGLEDAFKERLLPLFDGDAQRARQFLTRLRIHSASDPQLREQLEQTISLLLYSDASTKDMDVSTVRRLIAEFLLDHMHEPVNAQLIQEYLRGEGIRRRDWAIDLGVQERVM